MRPWWIFAGSSWFSGVDIALNWLEKTKSEFTFGARTLSDFLSKIMLLYRPENTLQIVLYWFRPTVEEVANWLYWYSLTILNADRNAALFKRIVGYLRYWGGWGNNLLQSSRFDMSQFCRWTVNQNDGPFAVLIPAFLHLAIRIGGNDEEQF